MVAPTPFFGMVHRVPSTRIVEFEVSKRWLGFDNCISVSKMKTSCECNYKPSALSQKRRKSALVIASQKSSSKSPSLGVISMRVVTASNLAAISYQLHIRLNYS